jgi:hypothetical protein
MPQLFRLFATGIVGISITIYVFSSCSFYEATWTENAEIFDATPGIYACKYAEGSEAFTGPKNFIDGLAVLALVIALISGVVATAAIGSFGFMLKLRIKNPGISSCLFMLAAFTQIPTYVVLISAACDYKYDGECKLSSAGYVNIGAIGAWIIASCFSRSVVGANQSGGAGANQSGGAGAKKSGGSGKA